MIDVKKILELSSEERNVLNDLMKLYEKAKEAKRLIHSTGKFEMNENEIDMTGITSLEFKNRLTYNGKWIITIDDKDIEVYIDTESIYRLFEAEYLVDEKLQIGDKEQDEKLRALAERSRYFRKLLYATELRAGSNN